MPSRGAPFYSAAAVSGAALVIFEIFLVKIIRYALGSSYLAHLGTLGALSAGMLAGSVLGGLHAKRRQVNPKTLILFSAAAYLLVFFSPELVFLTGGAAEFPMPQLFQGPAAFFILFFVFTASGLLMPLTAQAGKDRAPAIRVYLAYTAGGLVAALFSETALPYIISDAAIIIKSTCALSAAATLILLLPVAGKRNIQTDFPDKTGARPQGVKLKFLLTALAAGTISISGEAIALRIFSAAFINGNFIFSAVLFSYISGLASGYAVSGSLPPKKGTAVRVSLLFLFLSLSISTEIYLIKYFIGNIGYQDSFLTRSLYFSEGISSSIFSAITIVFAAVFPQSFLSGLLFPLLYNKDTSPGSGSKIAAYSAAGTAGNLLSLAAVAVLMGAAGYVRTIRIFSLASLWIAFFIFASHLKFRGYLKFMPLPLLLSAFISLPATGSYFLGDYDLTPHYSVFSRSEGKESLIEVIGTSGGEIYLMSDRLDEGGYIPAPLVQPGVEVLLPLMISDKPRNIFITGLGTGMNLEPLARLPDIKAECAELCPEIISAARAYFMSAGLSSSPNLSILNEDGWTVLKRRGKKYDLIITTLIHPYKSGGLAVNSREYFTACRGRLSPGGRYMHFMALNEYSPKHLEMLLATLKSVFPHVEFFNISRKFIMAACGTKKVSFEVMRRRYSELSALARLPDYGIPSPEDALLKYRFSCPAIDAPVLTFSSLDFDYGLNREIFFRYGTNNAENTERNRNFLESLADSAR